MDARARAHTHTHTHTHKHKAGGRGSGRQRGRTGCADVRVLKIQLHVLNLALFLKIDFHLFGPPFEMLVVAERIPQCEQQVDAMHLRTLYANTYRINNRAILHANHKTVKLNMEFRAY